MPRISPFADDHDDFLSSRTTNAFDRRALDRNTRMPCKTIVCPMAGCTWFGLAKLLPPRQEWAVVPEDTGPRALRNPSKPGQSSTRNLLVQDMLGFEGQEFLEGGALSPFIRVPGLMSWVLSRSLLHSAWPKNQEYWIASSLTVLALQDEDSQFLGRPILSFTRLRSTLPLSPVLLRGSRPTRQPSPSSASTAGRKIPGHPRSQNSWLNGNFPHSPDSLTSDPDLHPSADSLIRALPPENHPPPCGELGPFKRQRSIA
ncbi:hypothetical protein IWX90DRAFT_155706 [Phyllosticta citrichinensis]|uniref:Uncharacterized protein n=1 Tax=Phyllosticta citrichinensis TaxID=1130410 RepID=A0ABR1XZV3_9PEZI